MTTTICPTALYARDGDYYRPVADVIAYYDSTATVRLACDLPTGRTVQLDQLVVAEYINLYETPHVGAVDAAPYANTYEARCHTCGVLSEHDSKEAAARALRAHRADLGLADHPKVIIT